MINPSTEIIRDLAKDYKIIPVCKEIYADVATTINILKKIALRSNRYYLLESVEGGETWGRYSFLGYDPKMRVSLKDHVVTIEEHGNKKELYTDHPSEVLREILKEYDSPEIEGMPPFTGGFVGYFSYAMIGYAEPILKLKSSEFHDFDFMLFDKVIAYDHLRQKISVIVNMKTDDILYRYGEAMSDIEKIIGMLKENIQIPTKKQEQEQIKFTCNVTPEDYEKMIDRAKEYIKDGDIFQAVLSRRFESTQKESLLNAYRVLRTTNPSPYMVFMHIDDVEIMSTSPETLVRLKDGKLITFPVAGSRPRGATKEEDELLEKELLADEKELSEHNMLVDLGRNDLGKISEFGSVEVTAYKQIHRYSKIMHICSQVEGKIKDEFDAFDAIESVLPAGTLSGAPKIRACQIIEELEKCPRGIYGGALGYIDFKGNLDTCIAIRMAVKKGDKVYVQAGGGIVADSVAQKEYEESHNKAAAVIQAIQTAGEATEI